MKLNVIPIPDARLVPRHLVEQVKDRDWDVDQWYKLMVEMKGDITNVLLGLVNEQCQVIGFVWLDVDGFAQRIFINTISVEKEYQFKKYWFTVIKKYIQSMAKKIGITRVLMAAKRTEKLKKLGFRESQYKILEYEVK